MLFQVRRSDAAATAANRTHDFLIVCSDHASLKSLEAAVRQVNARFHCAANTIEATECVSRQKVDGIVIDMSLRGSLELIHRIRNGSSNRGSMVFACMGPGPENQMAIRAGANFVLHRPLIPEKIAHIFRVAAGLMVVEKRRCFRYPLMIPVELKMKARQVESTMSNLSEGGMAMWSLFYYNPGSQIHFAFEIPFGGIIRGHGEVAWIDADGLAGVRFNTLPDRAYTYLSEWFARRDGTGPI